MRYSQMLLFSASLLIAGACPAKESVTLKTGFSVEADSCTQEGQLMILHIGNGSLAFPLEQVSTIVEIPDPATGAEKPPIAAAAPEDLLAKAALNEGLDPSFMASVAKTESALRQNAISPKGAVGLMQLIPATAAELGVNPADASENAKGGAMYLRQLLIRYNGNSALALAAYNAGPGAVAKYGGVPPYAETLRYIRLVLADYQRTKKAETDKPNNSASKPNATN